MASFDKVVTAALMAKQVVGQVGEIVAWTCVGWESWRDGGMDLCWSVKRNHNRLAPDRHSGARGWGMLAPTNAGVAWN